MTVQIDFDHPGTTTRNDAKAGFLMLHDPEKEIDYASWPFHVDPSKHSYSDAPVWEWQNPDDPIEEITLSPSLKLEWDDPNTFHIHIREGEVEHCGDCMCGCQ